MRTFHFDGRSSADFLFINKVHRPILPPLTIQTTKIPQRPGSLPFHTGIEERTISVDVTLMNDNDTALRDNIRALASWLYTTEDKELYFSDETNRVYKARLSGETALEQFASMGEGTLVFICHDPFGYATFEKSIVMNEVISNVNLIPQWKLYNTYVMDWYRNMVLSEITFPSGASGLRAELVDVTTANGHMRTLTTIDNLAQLTAGETYTASISFNCSAELTKVEMFNIYFYDIEPKVWQTFPGQMVDSIPIDNEEDGTRLIQYTFVSEHTGGARLSFGFGKGTNNANVNGSYYQMKSMKIEEGSVATPSNNENVKMLGAEVTNEGTYNSFPMIRFVPYQDIDFFRVKKDDTGEVVNLSGTTFPAWVPVIIDLKTNRAYFERTGETLMKYIELESEFFGIDPGTNTLTYLIMNGGVIVSNSQVGVRAIYKERWI